MRRTGAALRVVQGGGPIATPPLSVPVRLPEVGPKWQVVALVVGLWTALQCVARFIVQFSAKILRFFSRPRSGSGTGGRKASRPYALCGAWSVPRRLCHCHCHIEAAIRPLLYVAPLVVEHFFLRRCNGKMRLTLLGQFPWCLRCNTVTTCTVIVNGHTLHGWREVRGGYQLELETGDRLEDIEFVSALAAYCCNHRQSRVRVTVEVDGRMSLVWLADLDCARLRLVQFVQ
jgi:hypothetical protein